MVCLSDDEADQDPQQGHGLCGLDNMGLGVDR